MLGMRAGKETTDAQPVEVGWDWDTDRLALGLYAVPPLPAKERVGGPPAGWNGLS